jgi:hypothetical protein
MVVIQAFGDVQDLVRRDIETRRGRQHRVEHAAVWFERADIFRQHACIEWNSERCLRPRERCMIRVRQDHELEACLEFVQRRDRVGEYQSPTGSRRPRLRRIKTSARTALRCGHEPGAGFRVRSAGTPLATRSAVANAAQGVVIDRESFRMAHGRNCASSPVSQSTNVP